MPNKKAIAKQACPSLEDQKQAEFPLKEKIRKTAEGTLEQELITPLVVEGNEHQCQRTIVSYRDELPGLHASSLGLAESINGSLSAVNSQASASHSSWIDSKQGVYREESSSHATSADSYSYRFQCQTIHSAPNCQFLGMKNCQVATQEQVSRDTETVYTGSVGHRGSSDFGGMQKLGSRNHDDTQSADYNQLLDQNSWVNNNLEASRQHLGCLSIKQSGGAKTPSDEPLAVTNYFDSMNSLHQEMESGSDETVTAKVVPVGHQTSGVQPTFQDLQGNHENYENSSSHNIGKVQRDTRFRNSVEPYSKMTKKTRELLKKKKIQDQLDFVDNFHGVCPNLVYIPTFSAIQENENMTPLSPTWPGK